MALTSDPYSPETSQPLAWGLPCPVVGVGASAGGLDALSHLLGALSPTTGMAIVIVSHLDPDQPSLLAELLAKTTSLPVRVVRHGEPVAPDHVYVLPPNAALQLVGQELHLTPRPSSPRPHLPIDFFFQSLAAANGAAAIGVVLSGTGTDGTLGLCAIKDAGGVTMAQSPESAAYPQLPQNAITSGCVDRTLPPEELAAAIAELASRSRTLLVEDDASDALDESEDLQPLFGIVQTATGVDFSAYKRSTILRRVQRRMDLRHIGDLSAYLQFIREQPDEAQALAQDFLIGVTEFFRDREAFEALQQTVLMPMLLQRSSDLPARIWVIGCATGQEAYSIAMLLIETAESVGGAAPVQIFATDLNEEALATARAGIYAEASVQSLSPARRERFFSPVAQGYQVAPNLREHCVFARHNLLVDPPFSNLDLICCRNVLIYLGRPLQQQVLPLLHYALNPGGVLMLGVAEQLLAVEDRFTPLDTTHRLYVRTGSARKFAMLPLSHIHRRAIGVQGPTADAVSERDRAMEQTAHRIMATHYAQPGVLITPSYDILHIYGYTGGFLEPAPGETSMNLLRMARDGLLAALQQAVGQATTQQTVVRIERVRLLAAGEPRSATIEVTPIRDPRSDSRLFLVVFQEERAGKRGDTASIAAAPVAYPDEWREEMQALRSELAASKAYLRTIIAEQVATNDELKLLNEELLSRNEEVQSVNEELQTAKEEVQSINEELVTVNDELQQRNSEISAINSDLNRLLISINIPIVMLDHTGAVARFTPPAAELLDLRHANVGRPLRNAVRGISSPDLDTLVSKVLSRGQPAEIPLDDEDGHAYLLRIWPAYGVDGIIDGVVLVWIDVVALKEAEASRMRLERSLLEAQKLESLGVLAGGVAHDFNNLLAIILGNAQLALLNLEPDAPALASVEQIEETSQRAIELTRQMLAYAGKGTRDLEVVDLNALIESTDNLLRASIDKQVTLRYALHPAPLWALVDSTQIRQVLVNLVLNAAEAGGATASVVDIRSEARWLDRALLAHFQVGSHAEPALYVVLEVADNGVGMDAATVAKIFEPFFSTKFAGRGLGLAAASGIIQGHRGAIRVQSAPGRGATMTVALPQSSQPDTPPHGEAEAQPLRPRLLHRLVGKTVLVIDDEDGVRGVATQLLKRLGMTSIMASDGAAGIAKFQQHAPDVALVLLDVTMPGLETRQIVEALRAQRADVAILLMSGYPKESVKGLVQVAGFLPKPFTLAELQEAVAQALVQPRV